MSVASPGYGLRLACLAVLDFPTSEQAIPSPRCRLQHASIRAERLADRGNVNVKRIFPDDGARPYAPHQIVFCDELTASLGQGLDDLECAVPEDHWGAA
jgi:hypothetical protein